MDLVTLAIMLIVFASLRFLYSKHTHLVSRPHGSRDKNPQYWKTTTTTTPLQGSRTTTTMETKSSSIPSAHFPPQAFLERDEQPIHSFQRTHRYDHHPNKAVEENVYVQRFRNIHSEDELLNMMSAMQGRGRRTVRVFKAMDPS